MGSIRFSYSRLECYNQCGWKYKLKYVDGRYLFQPNAAAAYGTLVHAIEERMALALKRGEQIDFDTLRYDFQHLNVPKRSRYDRSGDVFGTDVLSQKFRKDWYNFDTKSGQSYAMKAKMYASSGIYLFPNFMAEHPELEVVGAELSFEFEYRNYIFTGFIDRLLKYRGTNRYLIQDIKTKDTPYDHRDLTTPLQFLIYQWAVEHTYGKGVEVECQYELPTVGIFQDAGTRGWQKRGEKKINSLLDGIEDTDWKPHPSPLCAYCEFGDLNPSAPQEGKGLCPYHSMYRPGTKDGGFQSEFEWEGFENHEAVMQKYRIRKAQEAQLEQGLPPVTSKYSDIDF